MKNFKIAVDGPAGAGKSSVAKKIAESLGIVYVDTGAMYRTAALFALRKGIDIKAQKELLPKVLDDIKMDIVYTEKGQRMLLDGEDVSGKIREEKVSMAASDIATIPEVRVKLVEMQREIAKNKSVIMDGRDIGTSVLPDAELKVYLTASAECRAKRRYDELCQKGAKCSYDDIFEDIKKRDENDMGRKIAPLRCAEDAVLVDSTDMTFDEVLEKIKALAEKLI